MFFISLTLFRYFHFINDLYGILASLFLSSTQSHYQYPTVFTYSQPCPPSSNINLTSKIRPPGSNVLLPSTSSFSYFHVPIVLLPHPFLFLVFGGRETQGRSLFVAQETPVAAAPGSRYRSVGGRQLPAGDCSAGWRVRPFYLDQTDATRYMIRWTDALRATTKTRSELKYGETGFVFELVFFLSFFICYVYFLFCSCTRYLRVWSLRSLNCFSRVIFSVHKWAFLFYFAFHHRNLSPDFIQDVFAVWA